MKRTIVALLVALIAFSAPAYAGGYFRKGPKHHHSGHHSVRNVTHDASHGLAFLLKLPVRVVTSTTVGLAGIVADQNMDGFERGYNLI